MRLLAPLLLLAATTAHAQPTERYVVQAGDSCRRLAQRLYGDRARVDLIHAHNPQLGPGPHRLEPGTSLRVLPEPLREAEATLVRKRREVQARRGDEPWADARIHAPLQTGHQVATGERATAELAFRDGARLQMRSRSLVILVGSGRARRRDLGEARLERGVLRSRLAELAGEGRERLALATPSADTRLGAESVVRVAEDGESIVAALRGDSEVGGVRVPEGMGTRVRRGERPARPRPLPPAPRWSIEARPRVIGLGGSGASLSGHWEPVEEARRYRVEISTQPDGRDLFAALEIVAPSTSFTLHRVPAGVYYARVATIDGEGFEGRASPRRAFTVRVARVVPPGGGDPPPDVHDPGDPSRPWTPPQLLPGTLVVAPYGVRCGAPRASGREPAELSGIATLRSLGRYRLRCRDRRNRSLRGPEVVVRQARATVLGRPTVPRGGGRRLTIRLRSPLRLPDRLIAQAPEGVAVGSVRRVGRDRFTLEVGVTDQAPRDVRITLQVAAGAERIDIATLTLRVTDG